MWHDNKYHLHKDEKLPLLPHEYDYYSRGLVNSDKLHEYPSLKSLIESNCDNGKSLMDIWSTDDEFTLLSFEQMAKPSFSHLKRIFFSQLKSAFDTSQTNGKFKHDFHEDESLYSIHLNPTTNRYEISTKLPTLLVHAVFSHNVEFRDNFISYPIVSEESRRKYCPNNCLNHLCSICEESNTKKHESKLFFSRPWCFKPNLNLGILSIEDGIYDFGVSNRNVPGSVFDKNGNILIMSNPHSLKFDYQAPVKFEPMFATVGISYNPTAPGHFPIEVLPRVVFLSYFLPLHIPILMNSIGKNRLIIESFKEMGIIHPKRKIIWARESHYYIGKRVYFLHSKDEYAPLTPDIVMRMVSTIYSKAFKTLRNSIQHHRKEYILVIDRSDIGNRMITNQDEMINSLKEFTKSLNIDVIPVKLGKLKSFIDIGAAFYGAIAIIAPNGAGLANMNAVNREKIKFIMEVGWIFGWPGDFWCGSRSLGIRYIPIVCDDLKLIVNIKEVLNHVKREFKDYTPPTFIHRGLYNI